MFIRIVLEKSAVFGNPAEQAIGEQLLARGARIHERPQRMVESAIRADDCLLIDSCGL
jgi:hypothetical protein